MAEPAMVQRVGQALAEKLAAAWGAELQPNGRWSVTFAKDASFTIDGADLARAAIAAIGMPHAPAGLTGRTRVRLDWRGRVLLQVEERLPHWGRGRPGPPKFGQPDTRPTYVIWRDARQADLRSLEPPFVGEIKR